MNKRFHILLLLVVLLFGSQTSLAAQDANDPEALEAALETASSPRERYPLYYQLCRYYTTNYDFREPRRASRFGESAYSEARRLGDAQLMADAAWLTAQAYDRANNDGKEEYWLRTTMEQAMEARNADQVLRAVDKRARLATRDRNYRRGVEIYREALDYFTEDGNDIGNMRAEVELERNRMEQMRQQLRSQSAQLVEELEELRDEANSLSQENQQLTNTNQQRTQQLEQRTEQLEERAEELQDLSQQRDSIAARVAVTQQQVAQLSRQALEEQAARSEVERELAQTELERSQAELSAREAQIASQLSEASRNYAFAGVAILGLMSFLLFYRFRAKQRTAKVLARNNEELAEARHRSDELLLNILPAAIAEELKVEGKAMPRQFSEATIFFSDFVNFTRISELLGPEDLVKQLDACFQAFDRIIGEYPDIEKIKTIGDAYMCASGLNDRKGVPANIIRAALRMQEFLDKQGAERKRLGLPFFEARIGLHTGPVVAGVVGVKKFAYDVWGDTVNIASRVENESSPGRVNISETTYRLIKYQFDCEYRGKVQAKNKGYLDMYYVLGEK
ncbi:MAG: adenylate/guanylate cyclase domain-containing protein [Bacteroidota bacterium]